MSAREYKLPKLDITGQRFGRCDGIHRIHFCSNEIPLINTRRVRSSLSIQAEAFSSRLPAAGSTYGNGSTF